MNQDYILPNNWSIIEEGFDKERVKSSESLFSLGNGAMGQRANFEETYTGKTFQGSYIAGVYYPDKTKVGWWKNGYPEYFAKVLNAPNWIGIDIEINDEILDLNTCKSVIKFRRELNMKEGIYIRTFEAILQNGTQIAANITRFLSLDFDEVGVIKYEITALNRDIKVVFKPYIDAGISNEDANWDEKFWEIQDLQYNENQGLITSKTFKTHFVATTFMNNSIYLNGINQNSKPQEVKKNDNKIQFKYTLSLSKNQVCCLQKLGGYTVSLNHNDTIEAAKQLLKKVLNNGIDYLFKKQLEFWAKIWETSDITIDGDIKAQQGIRFNIFQLNQTYLGKDSRLNIGPKGFTGEKYGGSTYWDTEAYCIPFYMATKNQQVVRNLLTYRYNQLDKAIENAENNLGFKKGGGAALYPMVTMNGEECHNEWEITHEEIHRNGAIAFAIYNFYRYTADYSYIVEKGLEVLIGISRFWHQRASFSSQKKQFVILGVTGPNEYENNVNNNFYTNYIAKWCIDYTLTQIKKIFLEYPLDHKRIIQKVNLSDAELKEWKKVSNNMYFPYSEQLGIYLQQDGFLDKDLIPVKNLDKTQLPINQRWSWDRVLRSPYIKQADTLQGFYFFEDHFTKEQLEKHFDFYEPFTVHESSLSPCVHSILASSLNKIDIAYDFYLRTSRLDLDDYNKEVEEGCHITSMAGTWMSIVEGFGGMRIKNDQLHFSPKIPKKWTAYSFKVNFRNQILKVHVSHFDTKLLLEGTSQITVNVNKEEVSLLPKNQKIIKNKILSQIKFSIATLKDIDSVLKLQELYLVTNLNDEQKKDGFVTTPFNKDLLVEVIKNQGLFIAKNNLDEVIAYVFAESWEFFSRYPIFQYMISQMHLLKFDNHTFNLKNSFQYGPVCIKKEYRGKNIINQLFELMRENVLKKYPLSLTFINKINQPSMKAHIKNLNWTAISEFQFNNNDYIILAYDMTKSAKKDLI